MNKIVAEIDHLVSLVKYDICGPSTPYREIARRVGVKFLGKGVARATYLIDGKAYKFQRNSDSLQTKREMDNYVKYKKMMQDDPDAFLGWGIPEMEFIETGNGRIVVAAEYIPNFHGIEACHDNPFECFDAHDKNVFLYNGIKYLVDLG